MQDQDQAVSGAFAGAEGIATPQVVIDVARLKKNLARPAAILPAGVELHPHVKTHKSFRIARMQVDAGAAGITVSRPAEAAAFLRAGFPTVTMAYPVVEEAVAARLIDIAREHGSRIRFICDSAEGATTLAAAAAGSKEPVAVFLKVDVGLHRCGVDPDSQKAIDVARAIADAAKLSLAGLLSHAGHAYGAGTPDGIRQVALREREQMTALRQRLACEGIDAPRISVGSTPTLFAHGGFECIQEVRPGNYAFLDLSAVRLGIVECRDLSLAVVATVISANDDYAIVDAGSKTLSSDLGPHGTKGVAGFGEAYEIGGDGLPRQVQKLSEEHGFVVQQGKPLKRGTRVLILPNHSCSVANLASHLCFLEHGHAEYVPVDARSGTPWPLEIG